MFCPHCGNEIKNPDTKFCGKCGKAIINHTTPTPTPQNAQMPQAATSPAKSPAQQSTSVPYTPPQRVAPVVHKTAKVHVPSKPLIGRESLISFGLHSLLCLLFAGISVLMILLLNFEDTVKLHTLSGEGDAGLFSIGELLGTMINGNEIFNPTTLSTALAMLTYLLVFSMPAFALISFVGSLTSKKPAPFYVLFFIMAFLSVIYISALIPLSDLLVPEFRQAAALDGSVILADAGNLTAGKIFIFTSIAAVLTLASIVVTVIIGKRRNKK